MASFDEKIKNPPENDRPIGEESQREPGRGSDVEREGLTSRPSQKYPGEGDAPDDASPRPSSDEAEGEEDREK